MIVPSTSKVPAPILSSPKKESSEIIKQTSTIPTILAETQTPKITQLQPLSSGNGPKPMISKIINIDDVIKKMPGISISGITQTTGVTEGDIDDIIKREETETENDFEIRRRLTKKIVNIKEYKINKATAVVLGSMMINKAKIGIKYDQDIEEVLEGVKKLL